jgi:hypothetical protein
MRLELSVGRDGQLVLPAREAEALGLHGGGQVDVVTARNAFGLVVPARGDGPRSWFAGSLSALTVPEVIQFVFTSLKTGVLLLAFGDTRRSVRDEAPERLRRKSLHFREGQVVFASSSDPADRLGPVLVRVGLVSTAEVERCARLVQAGRPLGQVLVDEGVLTSAALYDAVVEQVREIVLGAFVETEGEFAFVEGPADEANAVKLPERTRELLLAGMRRLDEAERARAAAGAADGATPAATATATPTPTTTATATTTTTTGPFGTYRRLLARVHAALAADGPDAGARLNGWLDGLAPGRRALFEGVRLDEAGDLDTTRVLANVEAAGAHRGAAARARALEALEEFLAFALFEAKNRLPRAEAEALLREVGRMQMGKA